MKNFSFICDNFSFGDMETKIQGQFEFLTNKVDFYCLCAGDLISSVSSKKTEKVYNDHDSGNTNQLYKNVARSVETIGNYKIHFIHTLSFLEILLGLISTTLKAKLSILTLHSLLPIEYPNEKKLSDLRCYRFISVSREVN